MFFVSNTQKLQGAFQMEITVDDFKDLKTPKERKEYYERVFLPKIKREIGLWCRERNIKDWEKHPKIYFYMNHYHVCGFYPEKSRCSDPAEGNCVAALAIRMSIPLTEEDIYLEIPALWRYRHLLALGVCYMIS